MAHQALEKDLDSIIDGMESELLAVSHAIHAQPELAFEEEAASALLAEKVESAGLEVQRSVYGLKTAYATEFGEAGKTLAILSEYDALPGIGHACGHNIIAAAGLGAALALAKLGKKLPGRVRYLGTPAEERGGGKELMAREGAFDGVDAAMMVHPAGMDLATIPSLCVQEVRIIYHGRAAHAAAMPHKGLNALDGVVTAYQSIAQLRQHIRQNERIHGIITEGGMAANIVPERAAGLFYIRAATAQALGRLKERVSDCFNGAAISTGTKAELLWDKVTYLDVKHNAPLAAVYARHAKKLGRKIIDPESLPRGAGFISTDMGNISHRVPSIHPMIACAPPNIVIHHPEFARHAASSAGDKAVLDGAKAMALTALEFFSDNDLQAQVGQDYESTSELSHAAITATGGGSCC